VRTLELDKDGKVWAGTTDGVLIMSYKKGKVEVQRLLESKEYPDNILMSNDVVCLARDAHGMMWVGTNGGGLAHAIGQDSEGHWYFEHFGAKDGLPSEEIKCLTFDSRGNVWFATDHHICSFDQGKRIFVTYSNLEGVDETICSEASAVTLQNGHVLFGTVNGYYDVDQTKLMTSTGSMLKLRITDFWLNNELQTPRQTTLYDYYVPDAKTVRLQNHDDEIGFRFASLNYQLQHRVHYQYMLEGYDEDWQNAPVSRTAWYNNLPSGTYKFKVKAFLIDSPEKYDLKEIEVIVPPSFLMSRNAMWIYLAIGVVLCVMLMFWLQKMHRRRQSRSMKDSKAREKAVIRAKEDYEFMKRVELWMEKNYKNPTVDVEQLIVFMSMSLADFESKLKRITNKTPKEYISEYRIDKAKQMLAHTDASIADISFELGFANAAQFNRLFQEATEMTPSQYRDAQRQTDTTGASTDYEIIE
jgi:AraC-like DNA-binding protein